ncbi:MAG: MqnA/MqnD/SBP family protein [Bacteroidota bacterium]
MIKNDLTLGISNCPSHPYILNGMINKTIKTKAMDFELIVADFDKLHEQAIQLDLDIIVLNYGGYLDVMESYTMLQAGSSFSRGPGPILASKYKVYPDEINDLKIAIPGKQTTAYLLLKIGFSKIQNNVSYLYNDIEEVILSNETDAGLIMNECLFNYETYMFNKTQTQGYNNS